MPGYVYRGTGERWKPPMGRPPGGNVALGAVWRQRYETEFISTVVLSKEYGVSPSTIKKYIKLAGGTMRSPYWRPEKETT